MVTNSLVETARGIHIPTPVGLRSQFPTLRGVPGHHHQGTPMNPFDPCTVRSRLRCGQQMVSCRCRHLGDHEVHHCIECGAAFSARPNPQATDEQAVKERVLLAHAHGENGPLLHWLRGELRRRYPGEWVTADHARQILQDEGVTLSTNNALGALFRTAGWETDGVRVPSQTPGSHANPLLRWRYT